MMIQMIIPNRKVKVILKKKIQTKFIKILYQQIKDDFDWIIYVMPTNLLQQRETQKNDTTRITFHI